MRWDRIETDVEIDTGNFIFSTATGHFLSLLLVPVSQIQWPAVEEFWI